MVNTVPDLESGIGGGGLPQTNILRQNFKINFNIFKQVICYKIRLLI